MEQTTKYKIITWLKNHNITLTSIAAVVAIVVAIPTLYWTWSNSNEPGLRQIYDTEEVAKLAAKLASEFREEDTQTIKSLEETIKALTEQDAKKYNIQDALNLLDQGKTEQAEKIFELIALEASRKGKTENLKEAEALRHLGSFAFLHNTQKALDAYQRSTELDPDNMDGWEQLGHLYQRIGELEKAKIAYMSILKLAEDNQEYQAIAYGNLGNVYILRGDLDQAVRHYQKALAIDQELGNKLGMAISYGNLGNVYQIREDLDQAVEHYQKALAINEELGRKQGIAITYGNLGNVYKIRGDSDQAIEHYQKALTIYQELNRKQGIAATYGNLGVAYRIRGDLGQAVEHYQKALAIYQELGSKLGMAVIYGNLGIVYQIRGELDQAVEHYQKALAIDQELGSKLGMAIQYSNLGNVYKIHGELDQAVEYWKKSLALFTEVGATREMTQVQVLLDNVVIGDQSASVN